jgi:hypothetical protein
MYLKVAVVTLLGKVNLKAWIEMDRTNHLGWNKLPYLHVMISYYFRRAVYNLYCIILLTCFQFQENANYLSIVCPPWV